MATVTTLDNFKDTLNGAGPNGALFADANGDLFGTTAGDGTSNYGTVFEVVSTGTGYVCDVAHAKCRDDPYWSMAQAVAFCKGGNAFSQRLPREICCYPDDPDLAAAWLDGWDDMGALEPAKSTHTNGVLYRDKQCPITHHNIFISGGRTCRGVGSLVVSHKRCYDAATTFT